MLAQSDCDFLIAEWKEPVLCGTWSQRGWRSEEVSPLFKYHSLLCCLLGCKWAKKGRAGGRDCERDRGRNGSTRTQSSCIFFGQVRDLCVICITLEDTTPPQMNISLLFHSSCCIVSSGEIKETCGSQMMWGAQLRSFGLEGFDEKYLTSYWNLLTLVCWQIWAQFVTLLNLLWKHLRHSKE